MTFQEWMNQESVPVRGMIKEIGSRNFYYCQDINKKFACGFSDGGIELSIDATSLSWGEVGQLRDSIHKAIWLNSRQWCKAFADGAEASGLPIKVVRHQPAVGWATIMQQ